MKQWRAWLCLSMLGLGACSPGLDWREVRPDAGQGGQVVALFPCKPEVINRPRMGLAQCKAAGLEFALSWAEVPDAAQVVPVLQQMRESLAKKLSFTATAPKAVQVPGMTPNPQALSQQLQGTTQQAQVAVFGRGLRVYQVVMLGGKRDDAAWDTFFGSVKFAVQ